MNDPESGTDASELSRSEVRGRALTGVLYVTASGGLNLLIGFIGNLALARMLTPEDFGVVAVGLTATLLGTAISDGGLGAGMIRRPEPPTRTELRTLEWDPTCDRRGGRRPHLSRRAGVWPYRDDHGDHDPFASDHDASDTGARRTRS